jgi:hypothetical protein
MARFVARQRGTCAGRWVQADLGWSTIHCNHSRIVSQSGATRSAFNSAAGGAAAGRAPGGAPVPPASPVLDNLGVVQKHLSWSCEKFDLIRF